jgi:hypothetical protein
MSRTWPNTALKYSIFASNFSPNTRKSSTIYSNLSSSLSNILVFISLICSIISSNRISTKYLTEFIFALTSSSFISLSFFLFSSNDLDTSTLFNRSWKCYIINGRLLRIDFRSLIYLVFSSDIKHCAQ